MGSAAIVVALRNVCVACSSAEQFGCRGAGSSVLSLSAAMLPSLVMLCIKEQVGAGHSQGSETWLWPACHVVPAGCFKVICVLALPLASLHGEPAARQQLFLLPGKRNHKSLMSPSPE